MLSVLVDVAGVDAEDVESEEDVDSLASAGLLEPVPDFDPLFLKSVTYHPDPLS